MRFPLRTLLACSLVLPAFASNVLLDSSANPGLLSIAVSYLVEDHRLNIADLYTAAAASGSIATTYANAEWIANFHDLRALAAATLPQSATVNGSYADIGLEWTDYFYLSRTDLTLPAPTLEISAVLHGTQTLDFFFGTEDGSVFAGAGLDDAIASANLIQSKTCTDPGWCVPELFDHQGLNLSIATATVLNCDLPGCWVGLHGWLEIEARLIFLSEGSGESNIDGLAMLDYLHTATFHVDLQTPGWTISSLSGAEYSSGAAAVPEPTPALLCLGGLLMLAIASRPRAGVRK